MSRRPDRARVPFGKPTLRDVVSGFVTGLFSIPEGMAYATLGNFSAPLGLWAGVIPSIVGSVLSRTVLMVTTLTSAIALTSGSVLTAAGLKPGDVGAVATMTVLVGVVMLLMGLLKLGTVMSFVSTAVMTGFTTGIAVQIVAGVIDDATGYSPASGNTVGKLVGTLVHVGQWNFTILLVTLATIAVWAVFRFIRPLASYATLISLIAVSVGTVLTGADVPLVSGIADIPRSLPPFTLPDVSAIPELTVGAVAIALVALAQAAGISAAVANPDGSRPSASGDFIAQGAANMAGGFFGALPTGGSLSRTGVATSAGAKTRWAGIFAGAWLALIVLVAGPLAGYIPMAVIGGLLFVIGGELIIGQVPKMVLVARTSWLSLAALVATFAATTFLPLQQAIFIGAALSIVLSAVQLSRQARIFELTRTGDGRWLIGDPPETLPSDRTTVLHDTGVGFFAAVPQFERGVPDLGDARNAAVVLSVRGTEAIPSATFLVALSRIVARLHERDIPLVVCGVDPALQRRLARTKVLDAIGADNVVAATPVFGEGLDEAYRRAETARTAPHAGSGESS